MTKRSDDTLWGKTTRRSLIDRAAQLPPGLGRDQAWEQLVRQYRRPITVCVRRHVGRHPDADEIVDEFFSYLFGKDVLSRLDQAKGRFRAFLQGVIRNFVRARQRREATLGGDSTLSGLISVELPPSAEIDEERTWARALLGQALAELNLVRPREGRMLLRYYGVRPHALTSVTSMAAEHGLTENAVHQALHRARSRLRQIVEARIRDMASSDADYEQEKALLIGRLLEVQPDLLG